MADEKENKVSKPYSLDPRVVAWVSRKANRLTDESRDNGGPRISESQLVNDILTEAMEDDKYKTSPKIKRARALEPA